MRGAARNAALVRDYREWLEHSRKVSIHNYTAVLAFLAHIGGVTSAACR